ncbi:uncharacterized protein LOC100377534 [Saccoglossus kowalevskii]|uniref:Ankyrin repeat domain-containing protein 53-like n=1 Tax=Saccoglossus kowalevskii TaxID=10224 RepID=A0ABM0GVF4_SACKO|nr:PREDICTED: ankyrin repeat domain-containing protein 53-like [Saccoglossus kowalevskii]
MSVDTSPTPTGSAQPTARRGNYKEKRQNAGNVLRKNSKMETDEFMAAAIGDTAWLKQSLRDGRDATKFDKNGLAAIHLAALHGRLDTLQMLVERYNVDVNLSSNTGWRPIHLAINNRNGKRALQCVEYLLAKEADPSVFNDDDLTPAHQAAIEGTVKCLEAVINAGGLIDTKDVKGHLPVDYAKLWGNRECARILTTEMWKQDKEQELFEMQKLMDMKRDYDDEMEEINAADMVKRRYEADQAFEDWLGKKQLSPPPSKSNKKKKDKTSKKDKSDGKTKEKLYQPNSVVKQDGFSQRQSMDGAYGRTAQPVGREPSVKAITDGKYIPNEAHAVRSKSKPQQLLPIQEKPQHVRKSSAGTNYSDDSLPRLPNEVIERVLSGKKNPHDRPLVFQCKNIIDVQQKKFLPMEKRPQSEVYMHLSHDITSPLYPSNAHILLASRRSSSSSSSASSSKKQTRGDSAPSLRGYDRERVLKTIGLSSKSNHRYPNIKGQEYTFSFKIK